MRHIQDEMFILYSLGDLSNEKLDEIQKHLDICEECQNQYEQLIMLTDEWDEPSMEPSTDFVSRVMMNIGTEVVEPKERKNQRKQVWVHYFLSAAATILFVNADLFTEFTSVSYQFIYGVGEFSDQLETITTSSMHYIKGIQVEDFLQLFNKE